MSTNFDDFFAKRDKKKKNKPKFSKANTDVIAKNLQEQETKESEKESENAVPLATTLANQASLETASTNNGYLQSNYLGKDENEDEWYDYENQVKDYSGLKINLLKIEDEANEEEEVQEDGENSCKSKKEGGPWNSVSETTDTKKECEPAVVEPTTKSSKYVPPAMRMENSSVYSARNSLLKKKAPDLSNEFNFPSLSAASKNIARNDNGSSEGFERARGGGIYHHNNQRSQAPSLSLGNKFSELKE